MIKRIINKEVGLVKRFSIIAVAIAFFAFTLAVIAVAQEKAAEKPVHKYIGAAKCKMCHNTPAQGEQFKKWSESKHAKAFEVLATPEALEVGKKLGVEKPQESAKCLGCHVTGFAAPAEAKEATLTNAEGVGCESCHGPGSDYKAMSIMKSREASIAAGMIIPDEKLCKTCHNETSPTYKEFVFADAAKLIAHPKPPKK
jgi:hypothetical protein